jgi:hypothetical protein
MTTRHPSRERSSRPARRSLGTILLCCLLALLAVDEQANPLRLVMRNLLFSSENTSRAREDESSEAGKWTAGAVRRSCRRKLRALLLPRKRVSPPPSLGLTILPARVPSPVAAPAAHHSPGKGLPLRC